VKIKVSDLRHHPLNEKIYTLSGLEELKKSIEEVGLLQPLTIDQHNQVISGNRRFESIKSLGWKQVEVNRMNVKDGEEVLLLIHANQQRIKSPIELLNEHDELKNYYKNNPEFKGKRIREQVSEDLNVSNGQLAKLLYVRKHQPDFIDLIDRGILSINQATLQVQRILTERYSRTHISPINGYHKDEEDHEHFKFYLKSSNDMSEIGDGRCDLVLCSPPFFKLRSYTDNDVLGSESNPEDYVQNIVNHLSSEVMRIMSSTGSFFIELGDTFLNGNLQNIPHRIAIEFQKRGFIQRNSIVVNRKNPKPSSSKTNLTPSYSMLFHFVKSLDYHYELSLTESGSNNKPSHPPRHRNINGVISSTITPYIPNPNGKNMGDFFTEDIVRVAVSNQKYSTEVQHPARFPEQLVQLVLNSVVYLPFRNDPNYSPLVVDPFCGGLGTYKGVEWFNTHLGTNIRFVGYDIKKWF
jgi:DNA modification methylase